MNLQRVLDQLFDSDLLIVPEVPAMTEEEIKVFLFSDCKFLFCTSPPQGLQKRVVKEYGLFKEEEEKITCPICLEVVAPGQEVIKRTYEETSQNIGRTSVIKTQKRKNSTSSGVGAWLLRLNSALWSRHLLRGVAR